MEGSYSREGGMKKGWSKSETDRERERGRKREGLTANSITKRGEGKKRGRILRHHLPPKDGSGVSAQIDNLPFLIPHGFTPREQSGCFCLQSRNNKLGLPLLEMCLCQKRRLKKNTNLTEREREGEREKKHNSAFLAPATVVP